MKTFCYPLMILLFALLLFASCARSFDTPPPQERSVIRHGSFDAPAWLWNLPQGKYAIGIAWEDGMFGSGAREAAKEFAAVSLSRNRGSFVVDKSMIVSLAAERTIDWQQVGYNLVVSADTDYLHYAHTHLREVDSYSINGYLICLYNLADQEDTPIITAAQKTRRQMTESSMPAWCSAPELSTDSGKVYSVASSHQANLIDAIFHAQEQALKQMGRYRLQNVLSRVLATESMLEKAVAMETVVENQPSWIDGIFVLSVRHNHTPSYRVFIRLKGDL